MIDALALPDLLTAARVVRLRLSVPFRGVTERVGIVLRGPAGWGEFAPFAEYGPTECSWWLDSAVESAFVGRPVAVRDAVGVNAIVPAVAPERAASLAAAATSAGCRTIKIKVAERGGSADGDADRIAAVRSEFVGHIRIDANGAWEPREAREVVPRLDRVAGGLQYVEQPCADLAGLAEVRRSVEVPVAADESIRRSDDPILAARALAADIVVLKVAPLGGVRRALRVAAEAGLPAVVSSALDLGPGLAAGYGLAAALPDLDFDCGLGTSELFAERLAPVAATSVMREVSVPDPVDRLLAEAEGRVGEALRAAWLDRLADAWHAGTSARSQELLSGVGA